MIEFTSFMSEHTTEYFLLLDLLPELSKKFNVVLPFYFWSGREGSNFSQQSNMAEKYHVLVVYPRRPKVLPKKHGEIIAKFNDSMSDVVDYFLDNQIPVVGGTIMAYSFFEIDIKNINAHWFQFKGGALGDLKYAIGSETEKSEGNGSILEINKDVIYKLLQNSKEMEWLQIIKLIRESKMSRGGLFWHSVYKPFFIIVNA